jgi:VRR-NUC domain-containing protein
MVKATIHIPERAFQDSILEALAVYQWRAIHVRPCRTKTGWRTAVQGPGATGWPDVLAVREERVLVAELKAMGGRLRSDQEEWLAALRRTAVEVYVWTPGDWDEIGEVLR